MSSILPMYILESLHMITKLLRVIWKMALTFFVERFGSSGLSNTSWWLLYLQFSRSEHTLWNKHTSQRCQSFPQQFVATVHQGHLLLAPVSSARAGRGQYNRRSWIEYSEFFVFLPEAEPCRLLHECQRRPCWSYPGTTGQEPKRDLLLQWDMFIMIAINDFAPPFAPPGTVPFDFFFFHMASNML